MQRVAIAAALSAAVGLSGCFHPSMRETTLGREVELSAIAEPGDERRSASPSQRRADWPPIEFLVPNDQSTALKRFTTGPDFARISPRQRGDFPSADDAALIDREAAPLRGEALAAPVAAAIDVLAMPFGGRGAEGIRWYERCPDPALSETGGNDR